MNLVAAAGSVVAGAVLAILTIVGGVQAVSPDANTPAKGDQVVSYDAP